MRQIYFFLVWSICFIPVLDVFAQDTVTDYDGNVYHTITIGSQVWLKENLASLHYSDGSDVPGVAAYNNSDSLAGIFGRLYNWDAVMKNSTQPGAQGICPVSWHVPSSAEYNLLVSFLGGSNLAGGKMKDTIVGIWNYSPDGGATNSSGFSALPAGEYDAYQYMTFQLLHQYGVFWTSSQTGSQMATERYLEYNSTKCLPYNWYKTMKYSARCVRDAGTGISIPQENQEIDIINPVKDRLRFKAGMPTGIRGIEVFDMEGRPVMQIVLGGLEQEIILDKLKTGSYILRVFFGDRVVSKPFLHY